MFRVCAAAVVTGSLLVLAPFGHAQPGAAPTLPVFTPHPSNWSPNYSVFPYNLWRARVTPEQITAMRDSCQWFNAQYDEIMNQAYGFQTFLGDRHDDWTTAGMSEAGDVVVANLNQSAAFLDPRAHTLFIVNYPDRSEYSPVFHGDSVYRLWYQFTQIRDKIERRLPAGQINANTATASVYGRAIRDAGVCVGA